MSTGYPRGVLAVLSAGAAAIHFAVLSEHFREYWLFGVFFLVVAWAQVVWAVAVGWRPARPLLWAGAAGNAVVVVIYLLSRTTGLPLGPSRGTPEPVGGLDIACAAFEAAIALGTLVVLLRPNWLPDRVSTGRSRVLLAGAAAVVVAVTSAFLTPVLAGPEGAAATSAMPASPAKASGAAGMTMVGSAAPPSASQIAAADQLIKQVTASLSRYTDVNAALAAGYRPGQKPKTGAESEVHYALDPAQRQYGLDPQRPEALVYAVNVPGHPPVLLGALFVEPPGTTGPQVGGGLTQWHLHTAAPGAMAQIPHMHVWVAPNYPGGPFSPTDTLSGAALGTVVSQALAAGI